MAKRRTKRSHAKKFSAAAHAFARFCETIATVRDPQSGCPWHHEQSHASLRRYMLEEAYEATHAMAGSDMLELCSELGDVLLQVVLNAQIATEHRDFAIADVIKAIDAKIRRRNPHIFAARRSKTATPLSIAEIERRWDAIKHAERPDTSRQPSTSVFAKARESVPSTTQALKIGEIAHALNFDWASVNDVFAHFESEVAELRELVKAGTPPPAEQLEDEIGDVYFTIAQVCRHLELDPETLAARGNAKFLARFTRVEQLAAERQINVQTAGLKTLEELWQEAKSYLQTPRRSV